MRNKWTKNELDILRKFYKTHGATGIMDKLPKHTYGSISKKAQSLGIQCEVTKQRKLLGIKNTDLPKYFYYGYNDYIYHGKRINGKRVNIPYHRHVMELHLGRKLTGSELVHHIDGNKYNNCIKNLKIVTRKQHIDAHREELNNAKR